MPKRIGQIRKKFLTRERLLLIVNYLSRSEKQNNWTDAQRKRWSEFLSDADNRVDRLCIALRYQVWEPQPFIIFSKKEGKKTRVIYESEPEDLVVDTLLTDCLNYVFFESKHIIPESCYGSIKGKGQHELRERIIRLVHGRSDLYAYSGDTRKYYPTIDQEILMNAFRQHIKDKWLLWLCEQCVKRIEGGKGIALGLPSSNPVGHIYHAMLDWYVILTLKVRRYYRFCDDKWMIHRDSNYLHTVAREICEVSASEMQQEIKNTWRVLNCKEERFECLGAMVNSHGARLRTFTRRRMEKHIKTVIRKRDPMVALQTWGGLKGAMRNCNVSNLIAYWHDRYPEFFDLVRWAHQILGTNRVRKRRHAKLEKILTTCPDMRSAENKARYGFIIEETCAAA